MNEQKKLQAICLTCKTHLHAPLTFPKGFLWGAASSAHQVEGGNTHNDWWTWEQDGGHIKNDEVSGNATDHYHRFCEDFDLAKQLGQRIHRLSVEWSRIEPEPGKFNRKAIAHYHDVFDALKKRKFVIMLTLHHFTNPTWFMKEGGWESRRAARYFVRFVEKMVKEYGKKIDFWITINEPNVYASNSYFRGVWPPQKHSLFAYLKVLRNLAWAHRRAYAAIHRRQKHARVGIAQNVFSIESYQWWKFGNFIKMKLLNYYWNHHFFGMSRDAHDFIGINYYFHARIRKSGLFSIKTIDAREEHREGSDMGWEVYPIGIFQAIMNMKQYNLPLYITENGIAAVNDDRRSRFIVSHIKEIYHTIHANADVRGYCYWSLTDNFEWDKGFAPRFGLIEIDYEHDRARNPRPSARVYARICLENGINHDLLRFMGHGAAPEPET